MRYIHICLTIIVVLSINMMINSPAQADLELKKAEWPEKLKKYANANPDSVYYKETSSLGRQIYFINDPSCPITLKDTGVYIKYVSSDCSSGNEAFPFGNIECAVPIVAYDVHIMLFDVWNDHIVTLVGDKICDLNPGQDYPFMNGSSWDCRIYDNADEHLTVVSFISRVRTADGKFWEYDSESVLGTVNSLLGGKATEEELNPSGKKSLSDLLKLLVK